ncbi:MAG: DUF2442 domain-containing protein [Deltaproteobacteria bacterium]
MLHDIVFVESLPKRILRLRFDDGVEGLVDIGALLPFTGIFAPLKKESVFRAVRVDSELGTIVWPNGADLDPRVLYLEVTSSGPKRV